MVLPMGEIPIEVKFELVENPPTEFLVKARVSLINKLIFQAIQEIQQENRKSTNEEVYKRVQALDAQLNDQVNVCLKIKNRQMKTEIMQEV